jgi:hypothetical protein
MPRFQWIAIIKSTKAGVGAWLPEIYFLGLLPGEKPIPIKIGGSEEEFHGWQRNCVVRVRYILPLNLLTG